MTTRSSFSGVTTRATRGRALQEITNVDADVEKPTKKQVKMILF
jgi:hypothetical protein